MQITVDTGREALERLAIEGYRSGALTHHQAGQLLGLSRFEFDDFLIEREIYDHAYSIKDLQDDWWRRRFRLRFRNRETSTTGC